MDERKTVPKIILRNNCCKDLAIECTPRDMNGDDGITEEFLLMREMTNLEIVNIYEGTANLHPLILDRAHTSLQAF